MLVSRQAIDLALQDLRRRSRNSSYMWNPVLWAQEVLGAELWSKQKELLMSLAENKRTAVKSCHTIGKSWSMGVAACWWVCTRGPNSLVVSTAPTYNQVNSILWAEIRRHWNANNLPGNVTQSDVWSIPNVLRHDKKENSEMVAFGRRPADQDTAAFQGLHRANGVLFLIDEAVGCPEMIFTAAEINTTSENCRILAIANPDVSQTSFGRIFWEEDPTWARMTISAYDTPNFTGEHVSEALKSLLIQKQWVEDMKIQWGEDSSRFKSKILAEFPEQSDDMFYTQGEIDQATDFDPNKLGEGFGNRPVLGVDVARMGDDLSTVYGYKGFLVEKLGSWGKADLVETANNVRDICLRVDAMEVRIDATGIGAGVVDMLVNDATFPHRRCAIYPMYGSGAPTDSFVHANARAERHDAIKNLIRDGKLKIAPDDKQLIDEMLSVRYLFNKKGAIQIESKEDMKKRGAKSPNCLDAVTYAVSDIEWVKGPQPGDKLYVSPDVYIYPNDSYGIPYLDALKW